MSHANGPRVMAIGIDSFDSKLARRLLDEGVLPNLAALLKEGRWSDVVSTAHIGSGSVWPTFVTGTSPMEHGRYGEWRWHPDVMDVRRFTDEGLTPFWADLVARGEPVGIFDVPFAPFLEIENGFEVNEWGAHDVLRGTLQASPGETRAVITRHGNHPFEFEPPIPESAYKRHDLIEVHEASVEGAHKRGLLVRELLDRTQPQFSMIVFPELHHSGHFLWHGIESGHPLFADARLQEVPDLLDVCIAIDDEVGRLLEWADDDVGVLVFSLHGMRPALGVPNLMSQVLRAGGFASHATWSSRTRAERKAWLFAELKNAAPGWVKDLYHRRASLMTQLRLARATMQEQHNWASTRAFALPTDQHGWGRVNLAGRELKGIVQTRDYETLRAEVRQIAEELRSSAHVDLVESVLLPGLGHDPLEISIPDVIVHWADAALPDDMRPANSAISQDKVASSRTGQHTADAFCIASGPLQELMPDQVPTEGFGEIILRALGEPLP